MERIAMSHNTRARNDQVIEQLAQVRMAISRLVHMGLTILSVSIEDRRPCIRVQNSPRCSELHGAAMILRNTPMGRERVMVAPVGSCQVEWVERGH